MSRGTFVCQQCGCVLGQRHHTGRLHPAPGVTIFMDPKGHAGPFVRLVCPVCHKHREFKDGPLVVEAR